MSDATSPTQRAAALIGLVFGGLLHLLVGWFYLTVGLVAPAWAYVTFLSIWAVLAVAMWVNRHRPLVTLAMPFVAAAILIAGVSAGEAWLGWTA